VEQAHIYFAHGARCRIAPGATPYSLPSCFECWIQAYWTKPAEEAKIDRVGEQLLGARRSASNGMVYVNYLEMKAASAYAPRTARIYDRLVTLKTSTTRPNFFRLNQNIKPTCEPKTTFELSHPEHAETRRRRDARVERRRDTQCQLARVSSGSITPSSQSRALEK